MAYINVPKDLTVVKDKIILGLSASQLMYVGFALVCAVPAFFMARVLFQDIPPAMFFAMFCAAPFGFLAFFSKDGLDGKAWLYIIIVKFKRPIRRPIKTQNFYSELLERRGS